MTVVLLPFLLMPFVRMSNSHQPGSFNVVYSVYVLQCCIILIINSMHFFPEYIVVFCFQKLIEALNTNCNEIIIFSLFT